MEKYSIVNFFSEKKLTIKNRASLSYKEAEALRNEQIWSCLANISLKGALEGWLSELSPITRKNYKSGVLMLGRLGLVNLNQTLQAFALTNHEDVLDKIRTVEIWSIASRQSRAALYISLTRFLARKTGGIIKRAIPNNEGSTKTFSKIREKVKTQALTMVEWTKLLEALEELNHRDALIAKLCLQGARRIQEVLSLKLEQLHLEKLQIHFLQSKTRGFHKEIIVTIPQNLASDLALYIGNRQKGPVFITSTGKSVCYTQIFESLRRASLRINICKPVHSHVLRTSAITYFRSLGFPDYEIQRLTGHASSQMLNAYDKTTSEDNVSKKAYLV